MKTKESIKKNKVYVGLSGGVDSSVSAALLLESGYDVVGVFIKVWQPDFYECTWRDDRLDAIRICAKLNIPFKTLNLENEYKKEVVDYMVEEYKSGRTPNPDVMCNRYIKFGGFYDWAMKNGADFVATGHYARTDIDKTGFVTIREGNDKDKDQTYFLWTLTQDKLKHCLFPVGNIEKDQVRKLAKKFKLSTAEKKDSQGLCFIGKVDLKDFLLNFVETKTGKVLNEDGEVVGTHEGAIYYTIGQRHGFQIDSNDTSRNPVYVVSKDINKNVLVVSNKTPKNNNLSLTKRISISNVSSTGIVWKDGMKVSVKIRYRQLAQKAVLIKGDNSSWSLDLEKTQGVVALGQSAVLYVGDACIGGGIIYKAD